MRGVVKIESESWKYKLGEFGAFVKQYEKARRPYPKEVFDFLEKNLAKKKSLILDLGCGTGISTRQLAKLGSVVGCDPDPIMLRAANGHKKINHEKYVRGVSQRLPFKARTFDAVTAFASFHWFDDKRSITEIKRVLKPGGIIFIVNKTGIKSWGEGYRRAIIKTIGQEIAHFKEGDSYNPRKTLLNNGFKKILIKQWKQSEFYKLQNFLEYIQSVSIWNSVPSSLRTKGLEGLKKYFQKAKNNEGVIERRLTVKVVVGVK
jgi:ubiquinone/menaquinone biosynthesis C-methylase UbiE